MDNEEISVLEIDESHYNPLNDVLFKFIFGREERKQITIDFLNAVLEGYLPNEIKDLSFNQSELVPDNAMDKLGRLDVACVLDSGEQVDIEVQVINQHNMERRTLFYWSRMYLLSLPAGKLYQNLKPAITINLLSYCVLPQDEPHSMYSVYNIKTGDRLNRDMELHFLEIPKYQNKAGKKPQNMSRMERWLSYFANKMTAKEKEELAMSEAAISTAMQAAREFLASTEERRQYLNREMAIMDYNSFMESCRQDGWKVGHERGLQQGLERGLEQGLQQGLEQGISKGKSAGEARMGKLISRLMHDGHTDLVTRVVSDEKIRNEYYAKYNI